MKILLTGANGFVGKNLTAQLYNIKSGKAKHPVLGTDLEIIEYTRETDEGVLDDACKTADFVFHLAGVNRPKETEEFMAGNYGFTSTLLEKLKLHDNRCPIVLASSTQAALDNPYGRSKKAGEEAVRNHFNPQDREKALIYRFPNVFGKWAKPNYNSAVATFCNNIANDLPIAVNDPTVEMTLVYIDDVVEELIGALANEATRHGDFCIVPTVHKIKLGEIVDLLNGFKTQRENLTVPNVTHNGFGKKLYSTYLSYLSADQFSYPLKMNIDQRGSFTEIIRTPERGQFSVNISKPGITKGQHWHHTKNEKFVVVSGKGLIQLRKVGKDAEGNDFAVNDFYVSGDKIEVVEMIPGYTHNIINLSETEDMVTFMWANESFDPDRPDTFFEEV
ncbi:MAG: capsular polysaccharide biosynthesis protein CapF [Weeksellaceae bacterium]|nr:capsular polysaccharide biosynthesis protein CapF [Weeksellaceae bacterium]